MVVAEQKAQILDRLLSLRDYSPFILVCDSIVQPAFGLLAEFEHRRPADYTLLHGIDATPPPEGRSLVIIEDLGAVTDVARKLQSLVRPGVSVVGLFHEDLSHRPGAYAPQGMPLLEFMATTVLRVFPSDEAQELLIESPVSGLYYASPTFNSPQFTIHVQSRRRSGRTIAAEFVLDSVAHTCRWVPPERNVEPEEDPQILSGLTTFNLDITEKQREERENVALPYLEAQELQSNGTAGGAIIYEFEKDDDYDEEDPYEDPF